MCKNIKTYRDFVQRVEILYEDDYAHRELEAFPTTVFGGFAPWRRDEFLDLARLHPEYHIVCCIDPDLFVNRFVEGAQTYFLAEGDADPELVYDPQKKMDAYLLHSLNSGRKS